MTMVEHQNDPPSDRERSDDRVVGSLNGVPMNKDEMTRAFKESFGLDVEITLDDVD
jgi:hypothetical protein